jgi:predicted ATP-dependent Lon-type protease
MIMKKQALKKKKNFLQTNYNQQNEDEETSSEIKENCHAKKIITDKIMIKKQALK